MKHYLQATAVLLLAFMVMGFAYIGSLQINGNFHEIYPGEFYRSAQLDAPEIDAYSERYGIRSIINLRGENEQSEWYKTEISAAKTQKIAHFDFRMSSHRQLSQFQAEQLIALMRDAPKPVLIHCRSGADRTGLATALYIASVKKGTEDEAEWQLSPVFGHVAFYGSAAYAMDETFELLEPWLGYHDS